MKTPRWTTSPMFFGLLTVSFLSLPITASADLDDLVLLKGQQTNDPDAYFGLAAAGMTAVGGMIDQQELCESIPRHLLMMIALNYPGLADAAQDVNTQIDDTCKDLQLRPTSTTIMLTSCSMLMTDGSNFLRWFVPPGSGQAGMTVYSPADMERPMTINLSTMDSVLREVAGGAVTTGNVTSSTWSGPSGTQTRPIRVGRDFDNSTVEEFELQRYTYTYKADPLAGMPFAEMGLGIPFRSEIEHEATSWVAPDAPGADVVAEFFPAFARYAQNPSSGMVSVIAGALAQMGTIAGFGVPIITNDTTTQTNTVGGLSLGGVASFGMEGSGSTVLSEIYVLSGLGALECGPTEFPPGVVPIDMIEELEKAMTGQPSAFSDPAESTGPAGAPLVSGAGAGAPPGGADLAAAMAEMNEALAGMSDEERAMLERFAGGFGEVLGGLANGNMPGMPPGAATGSSTPRSGSGGGSGNSAALMTDDLTQSVQNMLQALGYDPGNTDGELTTMTIIAISQFQAEQDLEVTGEVTPQLVGILAAAVDRQ